MSVNSHHIPGDGVTISSSTGHGGDTDYSLQVDDGTWVVLTAPETAVAAWGGLQHEFVRWWYQGVPYYSTYIAFYMSGDTAVFAEYRPASLLGVHSPKVPGVTIASSTGHGGVTSYNCQVVDGTWVSLTAPETAVSSWDGHTYRFVRWWYQGYSYSSSTIAFSMSGHVWVAAEYRRVSAGTGNGTWQKMSGVEAVSSADARDELTGSE